MNIGERRGTSLRLQHQGETDGLVVPLLTATEVGHLLAIPVKRVYEVVGHLAIQLAPHTLRWRRSDIVAYVEGRRRTK